MNDSKISVRYARALFESARDQKVLDTIRTDMESVQEVCKIPEFQYLVVTPVMKESQKCEVVDTILKQNVHPLTLSLLNLVFRNGREAYIQAIARNFVDMYKKEKGIRTATFTSAVKVSGDVKSAVEKMIKETLKTSVELEMETKEDLIGGFVIRIDDQQYDASVAQSLRKVKKQLLSQS